MRGRAQATIDAVIEKKKYSGNLDISIGTMIEIPRAALTADEVAEHADFFSFGTNDLTQMTFGYSRDDVNTFLPDYLKQEILPGDPVPVARHHGRRPACRDGRQEGPPHPQEPEGRHLRRARRRPGVDRLLPPQRARLCKLLAVSRANRPPGGSPGRAKQFEVRLSPSLSQTRFRRSKRRFVSLGQIDLQNIEILMTDWQSVQRGEHGGAPASIDFRHLSGLDYANCAPFPTGDTASGAGILVGGPIGPL